MMSTRMTVVAFCLLALGCAEDRAGPSAGGTAAGVDFARTADQALQAMSARATAMKVSGAAVVIHISGEVTTGWESRMVVVGSFMPKGETNVLAIAYTKAAEMADTLKDSGTSTPARPVKHGENGWKGGVIRKVPGGYVLAAFSGGKSEDDVAISTEGLELLGKAYDPQPAAK
jgi:hypothetical protein